MVAERSVDCRR